MKKSIKQEIGQFVIMCLNANQIDYNDVHVEISGHVNMISFRICKPGKDHTIFSEFTWYSGDLFKPDEFKKTMIRWREQLSKILNSDIELIDN